MASSHRETANKNLAYRLCVLGAQRPVFSLKNESTSLSNLLLLLIGNLRLACVGSLSILEEFSESVTKILQSEGTEYAGTHFIRGRVCADDPRLSHRTG